MFYSEIYLGAPSQTPSYKKLRQFFMLLTPPESLALHWHKIKAVKDGRKVNRISIIS